MKQCRTEFVVAPTLLPNLQQRQCSSPTELQVIMMSCGVCWSTGSSATEASCLIAFQYQGNKQPHTDTLLHFDHLDHARRGLCGSKGSNHQSILCRATTRQAFLPGMCSPSEEHRTRNQPHHITCK